MSIYTLCTRMYLKRFHLIQSVWLYMSFSWVGVYVHISINVFIRKIKFMVVFVWIQPAWVVKSDLPLALKDTNFQSPHFWVFLLFILSMSSRVQVGGVIRETKEIEGNFFLHKLWTGLMFFFTSRNYVWLLYRRYITAYRAIVSDPSQSVGSSLNK
jgi:hypothetical protein